MEGGELEPDPGCVLNVRSENAEWSDDGMHVSMYSIFRILVCRVYALCIIIKIYSL